LGAIFISYRRSDSQGEAGRVFDDLVNHFGDHSVFMDVAGIEAGRDFRKVIEESVAECGVLLVVMGPQWLNAKDESGARRLDDPADFVRIETASALKRDIPVVPVLVHGAQMPRADQLPDDLKDLAYRNCVELTHARWKSDIKLLIEALQRLVGDANSNKKTAPSSKVTASRQLATPGVSRVMAGSAVRIDPAVIQRVGRALALHIGPIADTVVRRAASRCTSVEDLYLKLAEEIDSPVQRQEFLSGRSRIPSASPPDGVEAATPARSIRAVSGSQPLSRTGEKKSGTPAPTTIPGSVRSKYWFLMSGIVIVGILTLVVAKRFAAPKGTDPSKIDQGSTRKTNTHEPAPMKTAVPVPPAETQPIKLHSTRGTGESELGTPQRVHVSPEVSMGLLTRKVLPIYPPVARQAHVEGTVILDADISSDGTVETLKATSGHPLLVPAAIDAVKQWRYKSYMRDGEPVAVNTQITVTSRFRESGIDSHRINIAGESFGD